MTKPIKFNLKSQFKVPGAVIGLRENGEKAKNFFINWIDELPSNSVIEVDFSELVICDTLFLDEFVLKSQIYIREKTNHFQYVSNLSESIEHTLSSAITYRYYGVTKQRIPIISLKEGKYVILSDLLEPNLVDTFGILLKYWGLSARGFSEVTRLSFNGSTNRLKRLYDYRLISRYQDRNGFGNEFFYFLPKP